jgi:2-amino-4-hydroxy-6-hydroxymethyldihydropteridine diphosphokinase
VSTFSTAFIGLGSNLDNPASQIEKALTALHALSNVEHVLCANWYESKAIGPGDQPNYINTVASLRTLHSPHELLHQLQHIENQQGRQREIRWGARTLDLDLLLYDNVQMSSDNLTLPHPEMAKRSFVLLPLYDLAPTLIMPNGEKLEELVQQCDCSDIERITDHRDNRITGSH